MFDWDQANLRKIRAHNISRLEVEEALRSFPIPIYDQVVGHESRFIYYGETKRGRLLALVVTDREERTRVVTAYDLDAGQKRDYLQRRANGE